MARRCGKRQSKPEGREFDIRLVTSAKNVRPSEAKKCPLPLPSKVLLRAGAPAQIVLLED